MHFLRLPALTLLSLTLLPAALAAPGVVTPRDLPAHHWAAASVKRVVHQSIMGTTPDGRFRGDDPVTRYELAVALDRFVQYIEAGKKPLHAQTFPVPAALAPKANSIQRQAITHLVAGGFLPQTSPLVTKNGSAPVKAKELSDALASVTIRLSDRAEPPRKE